MCGGRAGWWSLPTEPRRACPSQCPTLPIRRARGCAHRGVGRAAAVGLRGMVGANRSVQQHWCVQTGPSWGWGGEPARAGLIGHARVGGGGGRGKTACAGSLCAQLTPGGATSVHRLRIRRTAHLAVAPHSCGLFDHVFLLLLVRPSACFPSLPKSGCAQGARPGGGARHHRRHDSMTSGPRPVLPLTGKRYFGGMQGARARARAGGRFERAWMGARSLG